MALDGGFLRHLKREIEEKLLGGRIDKIHQPNREELVVSFRTRESAYKLLLSTRANSARVHFTTVPLPAALEKEIHDNPHRDYLWGCLYAGRLRRFSFVASLPQHF